MKKLLIILSISMLSAYSGYSQSDDTYYKDDESTVEVKAQDAPPPLPDYVQPEAPGEDYIWTPGYWAWSEGGYYWVAGVWVLPPTAGVLWTPGYWGYYGGYYGWHRGYWGAHVGYYGGVNYGFGYYGSGFYGGRWEGNHFHYNTAVWHVGRGFHNTYVSHEGVQNYVVNHSSFNGPAGVRSRPSGEEHNYMRENHTPMTNEHVNHERNMSSEKGQLHASSPRPATHSMSAPGGQRYNERGRSIGGGGGNMPHGGGGGGHGGGGGGRGGGGGGHGGGGGGHGGGRH